MSKGSKVFSVMVIGDNPDKLMEKYDSNITVDKYIKYKYSESEKMRNNAIKILEEIIHDPKKLNLNHFQVDSLKDRLTELKKMTNFSYYQELTKGYYIDNNGDAWSDENQNGKWQTYNLGDNFSIPLLLKNGEKTNTALYKDIDWNKMHMQNMHTYEVVWDLVHHIIEPSNDMEKTIYKNMKNNVNYFSRFKSKDEYVIHNCAYWNYAVLSDKGWVDIDDAKNDIEWISTFFDKFCTNLNDNDRITIFECTKDKID